MVRSPARFSIREQDPLKQGLKPYRVVGAPAEV